jgi:hypothetical protein
MFLNPILFSSISSQLINSTNQNQSWENDRSSIVLGLQRLLREARRSWMCSQEVIENQRDPKHTPILG